MIWIFLITMLVATGSLALDAIAIRWHYQDRKRLDADDKRFEADERRLAEDESRWPRNGKTCALGPVRTDRGFEYDPGQLWPKS